MIGTVYVAEWGRGVEDGVKFLNIFLEWYMYTIEKYKYIFYK